MEEVTLSAQLYREISQSAGCAYTAGSAIVLCGI